MAGEKRKRYPSKPTFGSTAPSHTMPFPRKANMTVTEIMAFLPNSINCADVVYRMISNGGTRRTIHAMINTYRNFEVEWSANCCGETMYKTMDKAGYKDWTIKRHDLWHDSRKASWDANRLDVGELRTVPFGVPAKGVPFRDLAEHVRTMPEGDDALDLTRMIRYCVQNSEDGWAYPKDYGELLDLLGGPAEVREQSTDGAVFSRWEKKRAPPPTPRPTSPPAGIEVLNTLRTTRRLVSGPSRMSNANRRSRMDSLRPGSLMQHRAAREIARATSNIATDVETVDEIGADDDIGMPYERGLAEYAPLPSPPGNTRPSTSLILSQIFQAEGFAGETDPYSAYAFGGPRRTPPYRRLEQIELPHPWDISGWAENLRWAFEQRVLFAREFPKVLDWTESPEHMTRIERERTQRVWASDELLELLLEVD